MNVEPLRKILPYSTVVVVLAALYVAYTFYSRRDAEHHLEHAEAVSEAEKARQSLDRVGGGDLKILQFYASPPQVQKGQGAKLCYGVAFAKTVRIEPPTDAIWPSLGNCVEVKPAGTTHYTLTARDTQGKETTKTTDIEVVR